ncbi:MAG TPA: hypothetical protein VF447_15710 [Terriglobales bacterium]
MEFESVVRFFWSVYNVYTRVRSEESFQMGTVKVGIREFREKLASYSLDSEQPLAITRHGDTVGYYILARCKRTDGERAALRQTASHSMEQ